MSGRWQAGVCAMAVSVVALGLPFGQGHAATPRADGCSGTGTTVARSGTLRIGAFTPTAHQEAESGVVPLFVCRLPRGTPVAFDRTNYPVADSGYIPRGEPIAGSLFANVYSSSTPEHNYFTALYVERLEPDGHTLHPRNYAEIDSVDPMGLGPEFNFNRGTVADVAIAGDGSVAWIGCTATTGKPLTPTRSGRVVGEPRGPQCRVGATRTVYAQDPAAKGYDDGPQVLSSGTAIAVGSLRITGRSVSWSEAGVTDTAPLPVGRPAS